ncbi:RagB/SusD family nutrient uptake outer membrane protein [Flavobacterium sp. Fl-318]|uniref:RagB/SusD family nutrient uptake outer membrane protein n=1 Tax=Flavobacterium cupriresistens TaxID=2893885 RepID=A0ABU4R816_9FLAO|nr:MULTISPECIES: RagB/SusD family nutrient uptake outer membrane protein [unclassified Flavobacterium]MDX6188717.1 RagB/SusD family nutrient uptake outer membrane protein [Flavobacterium sp. Fl-318]UFH44496.1 RagB/SusD family nutrient uptake outer membrane protein [Flavobacterium sp. F-323]
MKINISKYIIAALSMVLLGSCSSDFLDQDPTQYVNENDALSTTQALYGAVNGLHRSMYIRYESQGETGAGGGFMQLMDVAGEDLVYTYNNTWYQSVYNWQGIANENGGDTRFIYRTFYRLIRNANAIINSADAAKGDQRDKDIVKGQALFYRAFSHFQVVQVYGKRYVNGVVNSEAGVPIILNAVDRVGRSSVEDVYRQIHADLDKAIVLLNGYGRPNNSHLDVSVAYGLKARINLVQGNWAAAADFAVKARAGKSLMAREEYTKGFNDYENREWIWGSHIVEVQTEGFANFGAYMSRNYSSTVIRSCPKAINSKLYAQIPATDIRASLFDPTGNHAALNLGSNFRKKAFTSQKFLSLNSSDSRCDVPYMRVAEMYLIEAEAKAKLGQADAAQILFNLVKERNPSYVLSTKTGQDLVDEIWFQRRIELWGEGFRFLDLKRTNSALDRTGANHVSSITGGLFAVPAGDKRWQWLIPIAEINANPLVKQNER